MWTLVIQIGLFSGLILSALMSALFPGGMCLSPDGMMRGYPPDIETKYDVPSVKGQQPGKILVTVMTTVGWPPLFPRAAIVARELGLPDVVGCRNATRRLKTGDRVRVNGSDGLVEILASNEISKGSRA